MLKRIRAAIRAFGGALSDRFALAIGSSVRLC